MLQDGRDQGGEQTSVDVNVCVTSFPFLPGLVGAVLLLYRRVTGCRNTWYRLPRSASSARQVARPMLGSMVPSPSALQCLHSPHCPLLQWPVLAGSTGRIFSAQLPPIIITRLVTAAGCRLRVTRADPLFRLATKKGKVSACCSSASRHLPLQIRLLRCDALLRITQINVTATSDCVLFMTFK